MSIDWRAGVGALGPLAGVPSVLSVAVVAACGLQAAVQEAQAWLGAGAAVLGRALQLGPHPYATLNLFPADAQLSRRLPPMRTPFQVRPPCVRPLPLPPRRSLCLCRASALPPPRRTLSKAAARTHSSSRLECTHTRSGPVRHPASLPSSASDVLAHCCVGVVCGMCMAPVQAQAFTPSFHWHVEVPLLLDAQTLSAMLTQQLCVEVWHHPSRSLAALAAQQQEQAGAGRGSARAAAAAAAAAAAGGAAARDVLLGTGGCALDKVLLRPNVSFVLGYASVCARQVTRSAKGKRANSV